MAATSDNKVKSIEESMKENEVLVVGDSEEKGLKVALDERGITSQTAKEANTIPLLEMGKVFMVDGNEYKVCFVNTGQNRFSATPHKK